MLIRKVGEIRLAQRALVAMSTAQHLCGKLIMAQLVRSGLDLVSRNAAGDGVALGPARHELVEFAVLAE